MSLNMFGNLKIVIQVKDSNARAVAKQVEQSVAKVGEAAKQMGKDVQTGFGQVAGAFTTLFVAREVGGALLSAVQPAIALDEATRQLEAQTGATSEALRGMSDAALQAAEETAFTPTEALEGMRLLTRANLSAADSAQAIVPVMRLAQVGIKEGLDVATAAEIAGKLFQNLGQRGARLSLSFDQLAVMSQRLNFPLEGMGTVMARLSSAAATTGQSFENVLISFGLGTKITHSNERASLQLVRAYEELADAGKRARLEQAFEIKTTDAAGQMRDLNDIALEISRNFDVRNVEDFQSRLKSIGLSEPAFRHLEAAVTAFQRGIDVGNGRILRGAAALDFLRSQAGGASGRLETMKDLILQAVGPSFQQLAEKANRFLAVLGGPAMRPIARILRGLSSVLGVVAKAMDIPVLGTLVKGLFSLGLIFGTGVVAAMFFKGGLRILQVALQFTGISLKNFSIGALEARLNMIGAGNAAAVAGAEISAEGAAAAAAAPRVRMLGKALGFAGGAATALTLFPDMLQSVTEALAAANPEKTGINLKAERIERFGVIKAMAITFGLVKEEDLIRQEAARRRRQEREAEQTSANQAIHTQREYNGTLSDYLSLVDAAADKPFPPEFQERNILNARRGFEQLAQGVGQNAVQARAALPVFDEVQGLYAKMAQGATLTTEETARLRGAETQLALASGLLLGREDRRTKGLRDELGMAQELSSAANVAQHDILATIPGFESTAEMRSAETRVPVGFRPPSALSATPTGPVTQAEVNRRRAQVQGLQEAAAEQARLGAPANERTLINQALMQAIDRLNSTSRALDRTIASGVHVTLDTDDTGDAVGRSEDRQGARETGSHHPSAGRVLLE